MGAAIGMAVSGLMMKTLTGRDDPDKVVLIDKGAKLAEDKTEALLNRADVQPLLGLTDADFDADHDFLLKGDVFTDDVIRYWIAYKMENEVDALRTAVEAAGCSGGPCLVLQKNSRAKRHSRRKLLMT